MSANTQARKQNGLTLALTLTLSPRRGNSCRTIQVFRDQCCRIQRPVLPRAGKRFSLSPGERAGVRARVLRSMRATPAPVFAGGGQTILPPRGGGAGGGGERFAIHSPSVPFTGRRNA